jgi:hypothetical protein
VRHAGRAELHGDTTNGNVSNGRHDAFAQTYALSLIDKFPPLPKGRPFPRIDPADIVAGLRERVQDPAKQDQGAADLCCPAAFFYCVLNYKPELYVQYVIDLFTTGRACIGSLGVKPGAGCRVYQPPKDKIAAVDWVALASLRDSDNMIMDLSSVSDRVAARSREGEVGKWFRIGYREVRDDANNYFCKGRKEIEAFDRDMRMNRDVCLFVNDNMPYEGKDRLKSTFWNHCVVVDDVPDFKRDQISLSVYSRGEVQRIPKVGSFTVEEFSRNFYGYVSGTPTFN